MFVGHLETMFGADWVTISHPGADHMERTENVAFHIELRAVCLAFFFATTVFPLHGIRFVSLLRLTSSAIARLPDGFAKPDQGACNSTPLRVTVHFNTTRVVERVPIVCDELRTMLIERISFSC